MSVRVLLRQSLGRRVAGPVEPYPSACPQCPASPPCTTVAGGRVGSVMTTGTVRTVSPKRGLELRLRNYKSAASPQAGKRQSTVIDAPRNGWLRGTFPRNPAKWTSRPNKTPTSTNETTPCTARGYDQQQKKLHPAGFEPATFGSVGGMQLSVRAISRLGTVRFYVKS